ncbi:hypothetical protein FZEAL_7280 [Fusarium zealandicum]|uniref:NB-ARC domain-containing protein n=1 Tax=Fusarium zealandicum TaxID=1053134 RepID=A0A8H4UGF2_9HYPO|nr:hypothetical protein FZEAL_7280 [Fusarium zealandicum]
MSGPTFPGSIQGSNVLTGIQASGSARQTFNFNSRSNPRPRYAIGYARNEDFIPRPDINADLEHMLPMDSAENQSAALWGLGGSGKTQIALDYAHKRSRNPTCSVFWVHADNEATFAQGYKTIAVVLGLEMQPDEQVLLKSVCSAIRSLQRWVLVVDNADDLSLFGVESSTNTSKKSFLEYIPHGPNGTVLWTSRNEQIAGSLVGVGRGIKVMQMTADESAKLFNASRGRPTREEESEDVQHLLEELQWLPLAISQAGAYMRRTGTTIGNYLSSLKEESERWSVLNKAEFDRHRREDAPNSVLGTFSISIHRIKQDNETAYRILHVLAFIDNQNISLDLIAAAATFGRDESAGETSHDSPRLERAIRRLKDFSFITEQQNEANERLFELHKLVQDAARYSLYVSDLPGADQKTLGFWRGAIAKAKAMRPFKSKRDGQEDSCRGEAYFASVALQIMHRIYPQGTYFYPESWSDCERYLAHALQACVWAEICHKENVASELLERICDYLFSRGRYREIVHVARRRLGLLRKIHDKRHLDSIWALVDVGWSHFALDQYDEAEKRGLEALDLLKETTGDQEELDRLRWDCERLVFLAYHKQGRLAEAEQMATTTLDQARQHLDEGHEFIIGCRIDLAEIYAKQGKLKEAEKILGRIRELITDESAVSFEHKHAALNNLARICYERGQYDETEKLLSQVLKANREKFGEEHPVTLVSMYDLAYIWRSLGKNEDALEMMRKCSQLQHKVLGVDHQYTKMADEVIQELIEEIEESRDDDLAPRRTGM